MSKVIEWVRAGEFMVHTNCKHWFKVTNLQTGLGDEVDCPTCADLIEKDNEIQSLKDKLQRAEGKIEEMVEFQKEYMSFVNREKIKKHGYPRGKRVIRTCPSCGKFFDIESSSPTTHCSYECALKDIKRSERTYTRGKGGKRSDLNNQYFRSRWEANYARYLKRPVGKSTVRRIMLDHGLNPDPSYKPNGRWKEFISSHLDV
ncbi:hypothetical protein LCGC14_2714250, partial [marine sediment metagenome]